MNHHLITRYIQALLQGVVVLAVLLSWNLHRTALGWLPAPTPYTAWILLSWSLGYPALRWHFSGLFRSNDASMESYKNRALRLHQDDMASHHRRGRWTVSGVSANPWAYGAGTTQTTDEIVNPLFILCEHLWATLLLILFGPLIGLVLGLQWGWRRLNHRR